MEPFAVPPGFKIVSGGQTGADRAGFDWAIAHGVPHGGWCPKGRRAEDGVIPARYQLTETPNAGYPQRTEWNVRDSDGTVIFTLTDQLKGGSLKTVNFAIKLRKPFLQISPHVDPMYLATFLASRSITTLNVAGSRESGAPGIYQRVVEVLDKALVPPK